MWAARGWKQCQHEKQERLKTTKNSHTKPFQLSSNSSMLSNSRTVPLVMREVTFKRDNGGGGGREAGVGGGGMLAVLVIQAGFGARTWFSASDSCSCF